MTVEQLCDEYYWARKDISEYYGDNIIFSNNKEKNDKALRERYDIVYKTVEEVKSRLEKNDGQCLV